MITLINPKYIYIYFPPLPLWGEVPSQAWDKFLLDKLLRGIPAEAKISIKQHSEYIIHQQTAEHNILSTSRLQNITYYPAADFTDCRTYHIIHKQTSQTAEHNILSTSRLHRLQNITKYPTTDFIDCRT